jgi:hypothetical protein
MTRCFSPKRMCTRATHGATHKQGVMASYCASGLAILKVFCQMNGMKFLPLIFIVCGLVSACAPSYQATGQRGAAVRGRAVSVETTSDDGDKGIRNAISAELFKRGLQVVEAKPANGLNCIYFDEWKWDITMYLWALDLKLTDAKSGAVLAVADFSHGGFHTYPNTRNVVRKLFEKWDEQGVFTK